MEKVVQVEHLGKRYGHKIALEDVSFTVDSGSCFGLLGPNGAGKSTTMKLLTGITDTDNGIVTILGKNAKKERQAIQKQVGYVPQAITLYEKLSALDNLIFFGEMNGVNGRLLKTRISEVLEQTGLSDRAKDAVKTFSGGMKRRINIAAALLHKPRLLILDEPTVGIDPQSRNRIFEMIRSLKQEGVSIIYSTHYMEEVETLCDQLAIIDHGKVITEGSVSGLIDQYGQKAIYLEATGMTEPPRLTEPAKVYAKNSGWVIESNKLVETMQEVLEQAKHQGREIKALEMMRPTLETVFLTLTGTSLRD
ncbi:ABC transporter ATP-binding protein [Pullulanibacillus sp. KACC 23026]|uniref:ABC transporter ATP-binding protein n=1 Tax=Pullulanibacillus sp. KACC 23026 TaxID=3028315 RepID=UPI0023AFA5B4|nr:ABC transporter ATP-binding protein [Pullulanibacillus sp. KACC 23026]WEG10905.1 ABC transporter ATP-binding protein [Pullulanibacillus sp. KACC 23026]